MELKVYNNRVVFQGDSYFVRSANEALLGAWGKKKTPIAGKNYIDVEEVMGSSPKARPKHEETGPFTASFDSSFKLNHIGSMNLPIKLFNLGIDDATAYSMIKEGHCKFRRRYIQPHALRTLVNKMPRFREIIKHDDDYRFVTSVLWLESCTITTNKDHNFDVDGDFSLGLGGGDGAEEGETLTRPAKGKGSKRPLNALKGKGDNGGFSLELTGDDSGEDVRNLVFDYGSDTVLGYGLHKPIWDRKSKKKRDKIVGFEDDWQGVN